MKQLLKILVVPALLLSASFAAPVIVSAIDVCSGGNDSSLYCQNKSEGETKVKSTIGNVTNLLLMAVGAISIIMIVVGGILFALSNGDSSRVTKARNTVLYAAIGLIVSLLASAIVNLAFGRVW
jgi:hypothetical protein